MLKQHLKDIFSDVLSNIKSQIVAGILVILGLIFAYLKTAWSELESILQSQIPLWVCVVLSFLALSLVSVPALIINSKNKSLKKELESIKPEIESYKSKPEKSTLTFTNSDSVKIAPGIQVKADIKQNGFYCISDDLICTEHQRTLKPDNDSRPYEYTCKAAGCKIKLKSAFANLALSEAKDLTESHIRNTLNIEPKKTNRING
jgi:hypothetical protein